jgi:hypothetical protein
MDVDASPPQDNGDRPEEQGRPQRDLHERLLVSLALGLVVFALSAIIAEHRLSDLEVEPGGILKTSAASGLLAGIATLVSLRDRALKRIGKKTLAARIVIIVVATMVIGVFMSACHVDPGH